MMIDQAFPIGEIIEKRQASTVMSIAKNTNHMEEEAKRIP